MRSIVPPGLPVGYTLASITTGEGIKEDSTEEEGSGSEEEPNYVVFGSEVGTP